MATFVSLVPQDINSAHTTPYRADWEPAVPSGRRLDQHCVPPQGTHTARHSLDYVRVEEQCGGYSVRENQILLNRYLQAMCRPTPAGVWTFMFEFDGKFEERKIGRGFHAWMHAHLALHFFWHGAVRLGAAWRCTAHTRGHLWTLWLHTLARCTATGVIPSAVQTLEKLQYLYAPAIDIRGPLSCW